MASRRVEKTDREIKEAFKNLLFKKKIEKIKINEITELAQVSRATFYVHFEDIYNLYESVKDDILNDFWTIFKKSERLSDEDLLNLGVKMSIDYIDDNMDLIKCMSANGNMLDSMLKGMATMFLEKFYPKEKTVYGVVEVNFVAWGILGTIHDWVAGDLDIPKEQFNRIMKHVLARFIEI